VSAGHTLQESLDELMQLQMLSPALALRVLIQFDKSINNALATRVKTKLHFKVAPGAELFKPRSTEYV
jgi:transcription initiation factor TFIIA small subunit